MNEILIEIWDDLRQPEVLWQAGTLVLCLATTWALVQTNRLARLNTSGLWRHGVAGLKRVLFPLLALLLVLAAKPVLGLWHSVNLLQLAVPLLGSLAFIRALVYALRHVFPHGGMVATFERLIALLVWGVVALHIVGLLPEVTRLLDEIVIGAGAQRVSLWWVLQALFWAVMTLLVALWAGSTIEERFARTETLHSSLRVAFSRVARSLLILVAALIALSVVGIDLTLLSVFGGALGVGLGFGMQKIASNYVSGFIILLDRSIQLGDMITADNFYGRLKDITTRYVVVESPDGREAIIPNDTLITQTVLNHTHSNSNVRLATALQVDYGTDIDKAMQVLLRATAGHPRVLKDPPAAAFLTRFADSGIELQLGFWIGDPENGSQNVISDINLALLRGLDAAGIGLAFPQVVVHRASGATGS